MRLEESQNYSYMVVSKSNRLNADINSVLGDVFGFKKVTQDHVPSETVERVDLVLIDKEESNYDSYINNWMNSGLDTKFVLIGNDEQEGQFVSSQGSSYVFISKQELRKRLLTMTSRFIVDMELERYKALTEESEVRGVKELFVKGEDAMYYRLILDDLLYIEAYGNYIKIHKKDGQWSIGNCSIKTIENQLPSHNFCRIHRSYIVRIDRVDNFNSVNLEIGKKILPIGRSYRIEFEGHLIKL